MKNRLKQLRTEKGLTQEELGNQLGLANNTISRYETGSNEPPKFETWQKIADFFHVPTEYLLGITNDRVTLTINDIQQKKMHTSVSLQCLGMIIQKVVFLKIK